MEAEVATERDIEELTFLTERFWAEHHYSKSGPFNAEKTRAWFQGVGQNPSAITLILRDNGSIAGYIVMAAAHVPWGEVLTAAEMLWWVDPEKRGEGIGRKLMQAAQEWAELMKCDLIEAHDAEYKRVVICVGKS